MNSTQHLWIGEHCIDGLIDDESIEICLAKTNFIPKSVPFINPATDCFLNQHIPFRGRTDQLKASVVSVNNPHCVVLLQENQWLEPNIDKLDLDEFAEIQKCALFPNSTNVEIVEVVSRNYVRCRVLERGCRETMACGSGACAVVAVCHKLGLLENEAKVEYRGGTLGVRVASDQSVYLRSQAYKVFEGVIVI